MEIEVKRSNRKTMVIEITNDAKVLVRAPYRMPMAEVKRFVYEKSDWIQKHVEKMLEKQQEHSGQEKLTNADIQKLAKEALDIAKESRILRKNYWSYLWQNYYS